jgi:hypothetical protein
VQVDFILNVSDLTHKQKEVTTMAYHTPELLLVGATSNVVLGLPSEDPICEPGDEGEPSRLPELW